MPPTTNGKHRQPDSPSPSPSSSSTPLPPLTATTTKKSSTFRRLHPRPSPARAPLPSSPLRPQAQSRATSSSSTITRQLDLSPPPPLHTRVPSINSVISDDNRKSPSHTPNSSLTIPSASSSHPLPPSTPSLVPPQPTLASVSSTPSPITSPPLSTSPLPSTPSRSPAPYRPGFQPRGLYRPRTDEFSQARKSKHDATRVERTKLERRLEKLILLHFPLQANVPNGDIKPSIERRRSSIFDLDLTSLKNMDATDIWKGVVQSQAFQGAKGDLRGMRPFPLASSLIPACIFSCRAADRPVARRRRGFQVSLVHVCPFSLHFIPPYPTPARLSTH